jgi:xanthine dehydrogenase accessory factor
MKTLNEIFTEGIKSDKPFIMSTILNTCGSVPQSPGARMIIYANGNTCGTIGGGCVEGDVRKKGIKMLLDNNAETEILTISLTDEIGTRDGDICGGTMEILLERI